MSAFGSYKTGPNKTRYERGAATRSYGMLMGSDQDQVGRALLYLD